MPTAEREQLAGGGAGGAPRGMAAELHAGVAEIELTGALPCREGAGGIGARPAVQELGIAAAGRAMAEVAAAPEEVARMLVYPLLISSSKALAMLAAVSPIRLTCWIVVAPPDGPTVMEVTWLNTGVPIKVTVPEA